MEGLIVEVVKYLLACFGGYLLAYFTGIRAISIGVEVLLQSRLRQDYYYFIKNGITLAQKEDYSKMYHAYVGLVKRDSVMRGCYESVMKLSAKKEDTGK